MPAQELPGSRGSEYLSEAIGRYLWRLQMHTFFTAPLLGTRAADGFVGLRTGQREGSFIITTGL